MVGDYSNDYCFIFNNNYFGKNCECFCAKLTNVEGLNYEQN